MYSITQMIGGEHLLSVSRSSVHTLDEAASVARDAVLSSVNDDYDVAISVRSSNYTTTVLTEMEDWFTPSTVDTEEDCIRVSLTWAQAKAIEALIIGAGSIDKMSPDMKRLFNTIAVPLKLLELGRQGS